MLNCFTFISNPPPKDKTHELYDDKLAQVHDRIIPDRDLDIREFFIQKKAGVSQGDPAPCARKPQGWWFRMYMIFTVEFKKFLCQEYEIDKSGHKLMQKHNLDRDQPQCFRGHQNCNESTFDLIRKPFDGLTFVYAV